MDEDVVKFTFDDTANTNTRIKVIGVGGAGCNAVNRMIEAGVEGLVFAAVNTDEQALQASHAQVKLQLGMRLTSGSQNKADKPMISSRIVIHGHGSAKKLLPKTGSLCSSSTA